MLQNDKRKKIIKWIRDAEEYEDISKLASTENCMKAADLAIKGSIASSLIAITYILAMREDISLPGEFMREKKVNEP